MQTEPLVVSCEQKNPDRLFRSTLVPNLPFLKTVTLTAFRVILFALFEKFEV